MCRGHASIGFSVYAGKGNDMNTAKILSLVTVACGQPSWRAIAMVASELSRAKVNAERVRALVTKGHPLLRKHGRAHTVLCWAEHIWSPEEDAPRYRVRNTRHKTIRICGQTYRPSVTVEVDCEAARQLANSFGHSFDIVEVSPTSEVSYADPWWRERMLRETRYVDPDLARQMAGG